MSDPIEALAASMYEDDHPLIWAEATEQDRATYVDLAIQRAQAYNRLQRIRVDAFVLRCQMEAER